MSGDFSASVERLFSAVGAAFEKLRKRADDATALEAIAFTILNLH
jgi:hypothetical protein